MSKKKDKRTNNNLQNVTQKAKDRVTRIPHKSLADTCAPEESAVPALQVASHDGHFNTSK